MKILLLDPQKETSHRISKDTSGGYGTGNNFGDTLVPYLLKQTLKVVHDWPPMFAIYSMSVLKKNGHEVHYSKNLPHTLDDYDLYIVVSSIVCCETECRNIKKITEERKKNLVIGPFATSNPKKYLEAGGTVIMGEPEFFFLKNKDLEKIEDNKIVNFQHNFLLDDLPYPDWESVLKKIEPVYYLGLINHYPFSLLEGAPTHVINIVFILFNKVESQDIESPKI